jgi:RNA polymerase sigma factor (sigma-70 family)
VVSSPWACVSGEPDSRLPPPERTIDDSLLEESESLGDALRRNQRGLTWVLSSYGVPAHEVEDLLQDLAVLALEKLAGQNFRRIGGWLRIAAHHLGRRHLRHRYRDAQARRLMRPLEAMRWKDAGRTEPRLVMRIDLNRALDGLSVSHRRLLLLRAMGFSPSQIATRTGYAEHSIRKLIRRSLLRLASQLLNREAEAGHDSPCDEERRSPGRTLSAWTGLGGT